MASKYLGRIYVIRFSVVLMIMFLTVSAEGQWLADFRLTIDPDSSLTSPNNARCIAALGNTIHAAWYDNRDGNYEIYYKRSTDDGASWGPDTRLTNDIAFSQRPSIALSGQNVHIVWNDRVSNEEIYYMRSTNGGLNWGPAVRLTNNANVSILPSLCVSGLTVIAVWNDTRDGNYEIYCKRSTDNGESWSADTRLTNDGATSLQASCAASGSIVHLTWHDNRNGSDEIYYKRSTDGGASWGTDTRLTSNAGVSWFASVDASGNIVQTAWVENSDGNPEIYTKRSTDMGVTWGADLRLTNNLSVSIRPTISLSAANVHIVWQDNIDGNDEIYHKYSTNGGADFSAGTRLTNDPDYSAYPCHTVSAEGVHVIWRDFRSGNWEVYYKRNPTGNIVGKVNISTEIPGSYSLSQNFPNPFNPVTNIRFSLLHSGIVKLTVLDLLGREIETLVNDELMAGTYKAEWNASGFSNGIYFYRIEADEFTEVKKMILAK